MCDTFGAHEYASQKYKKKKINKLKCNRKSRRENIASQHRLFRSSDTPHHTFIDSECDNSNEEKQSNSK